MMIYNEFRPLDFDEVRGQPIAVRIIRNQSICTTVSSFIFVGKHGTGKTTIAKIFARALNCETQENGNPCNMCESCESHFNGNNFDIVEIDGASNNSVDDVRRLQDQLIYGPQRKKKVYIIDEAHMLSTGAFNALLKTLEEPPKYAIFILCTTEVNKIPSTIRSRCVEIFLQSIPVSEIYNNLVDVCQIKGFPYEEEGLQLIAQIANGSMRDGLSLLEKCLSYGELTYRNISDVLGVVDMQTVVDIVKLLIAKQPVLALQKVHELHNMGKDFMQLTADIIRVFRNIMVLQVTDDVSLFDMNIERLKGVALSERDCFHAINALSQLLASLKHTDSQKVLIEVYLMQVSNMLSGSVPQPEEPKASVPEETPEVKKEAINHNDYLVYKVDLIKSYDIHAKEVEALLTAQIFTRKDAFVIRTNQSSLLNLEDLKERMKKITGQQLNIQIQSA